MAECSYASCMQERRAVKKQLQKWTKTMICIVGLERIAEELMGKRKWKQYQDLILKTTVENDYQKVVPDWEPSNTCHLCNGPSVVPDPAVIHLSDSDSSNNSQSSFRDSPPVALPELHCHLSDSPDRVTMTTLESASPMAMAASLAAAAQNVVSHSGNATNPPPIPFYSSSHRHDTLFPHWYLPPSPNPAIGHSLHSVGHGDSIPDTSVSPATTVTVADQCLDQPLDLSAKTGDSNQNMKVPPIDHKHIFKAKPRVPALSGRKTYTEDELQAALRDIQSGKLGTRRAAVIYGIPRSTLRNKVYKLSMERERDSHLARMEDEDKELSGAEDEREVEKVLKKPMLSVEDILRASSLEQDSIGTVFKHASPIAPFPFSPELLGGIDHSTVGPFIPQILASTLLQTDPMNRLIGSRIPELVRRIIAEEKVYLQERLQKRCLGLGGDMLFQNDVHVPNITVKSETDLNQKEEEDEQDDASCRTSSPTNVILKIPSFKPAPKNGVSPNVFEGWPRNSELSHSMDSQSTHMMTNSDSSSSSPVSISKSNTLNLKDLSKSIAQKFQPQAGDCFPPSLPHFPLQQQNFFPPNGYEQSIFRHGPYHSNSLPAKHCNNNAQNNNNTNHEDQNALKDKLSTNKIGMQQSSTGKGTRPKRGKYRNYDRDSLMEAVRAVQRGEMSVHRAGSYYGVPHSTLEYKVKERHLMRPRKREPKPHIDDGKKKDEGIKVSPVDRSRTPSSPSKFMKPFSPTSPLSSPQNGLKIPPLFDSTIPLSYNTTPPFPFWSSAAFPSLPVSEFSHVPKNMLSPSSYRSQPEHFYASQMMQRLQEESSRMHPVCKSEPLASNSPQTVISPGVLGKNAREIAESLYDGSGTGGFLDGIIRSSLDMGIPLSRDNDMAHMSDRTSSSENIMDQSYHNKVKSMAHSVSSSDEESTRRTSVNVLESNMISSSEVHLSPPLVAHIKEERIASDEDEHESHTPMISQIKVEAEETTSSVLTRCENDETDNKNTESICDSEVLSRCETDGTKDSTGEESIPLDN